MRKIIIIVVAFLLVATGGWYGYKLFTKDQKASTNNSNQQNNADKTEGKSTIRLIATGDMLPHDTVNERAKTADGYDYGQFFSEVEFVFKGADVRFCNQEVPSGGASFGISGYPSFNAPTEFARDLSATGCNVINLANNHINDKGQAAINKTLDTWDGLKPLAVVGANRNTEEQDRVRYFMVKDVKFAITAYTEISNNNSHAAHSLNKLQEPLVRAQLNEARKNADIVLVSVHWGTEFSPSINAEQEKWSKLFADLGADIVIGHGPHVLGPVKRLPKAGGGETLVWYSLGNMLNTQIETEALISGFAVMDIDASTKKVTAARFLPTYMHYEWTADEKAREDLLKRKNLKIYPLDKAAGPLSRSLHNTTVEAQTKRITDLLNRHTTVPIITSSEY